ncbi:MAG: hypothetical protein ACERKO_06505 [Acetanaerobacterium sp.]
MKRSETEKIKRPLRQWGKRVIACGVGVMLLGLLLLAVASPLAAVYTLLASVLVNAVGAYLLLFFKKGG